MGILARGKGLVFRVPVAQWRKRPGRHCKNMTGWTGIRPQPAERKGNAAEKDAILLLNTGPVCKSDKQVILPVSDPDLANLWFDPISGR
jgi:hypothetical protein